MLPLKEAQIQSLVRKLRSCRPLGMAKKKKRKKKISPYLPEVSGGKGHLSQGPGVPEPSALLYTPLPRLQFLYVPG